MADQVKKINRRGFLAFLPVFPVGAAAIIASTAREQMEVEKLPIHRTPEEAKFHTPLDVYFYTVDNRPLGHLLHNDLVIADELEKIKRHLGITS